MEDSTKAYIPERIFTGKEWLTDQAIISDKGIIKEIQHKDSIDKKIPREEYPGCFIAPAFIDIQIYGAGGKLFAEYPNEEALRELVGYCAKGGAANCLPTLATNEFEVFHKGINAIRSYLSKNGKGVLGLHLEGPWINPMKRGAHIESLIHSPSMEEVKKLLDAGRGIIKMITLAPEVCAKEIIEYILSQGIIVSAGHSNATYPEAINGFDSGITTVTHLYNAMSPLQHRQPGLVGATFDHPTAMASIIPDGYHVDYAAIRIAKSIMKERLFAITDAVTETSTGYYQHTHAGDKYEVGSILSGSALTMAKACKNLVQHVRLSLDEALRMCSTWPAKTLKMDNEVGYIEKGYKSNLLVMENNFQVRKVIS
jgi:N-acetylglucosamine-6-phosphate deacetylase